ncbi:acylglycerol kinase, mitochondrial [Sitodiplosis mosellana]|uniref:acylglycerol kinase, mitochondrial n=1 Tax=Sitodiplosis mosellana TaxID=263140 RepID=UPI0024441740|nr:acylglycerol kinase, mitochondrial [Sitodiplosis mosellana]
MARITKLVKGVQNHWKKSLFGVAAITYGINYANEKYKINQLMRNYCAEASIYGDRTQPANQPFPKVIVILNPVADRKSAADTFEQYCAPILNLGGLSIDIVKTDSEGHARRYVEELETLPQAILCAGGDGTLSEIVTGLFRRPPHLNESHPVIGVLPVGRQSTFGEKLFNFTNSSELQRVQGLADASLAIVLGNVVPKDVMKIELIDAESNVKAKPVYALSSFEWSAFTDAFNRRDRYWYVGGLRDYVTFIFNAFDDSITWNCAAKITYTEPCAGCSNCYVTQKKSEAKSANRRWWSGFIPSFRLGSSQSNAVKSTDYSKVQNANCANVTSIECDSAGIIVSTENIKSKPDEQIPHLSLKLIKGQSGFGFIGDGWDRLNKKKINIDQNIAIRSVEIHPKISIKEENLKLESKNSENEQSNSESTPNQQQQDESNAEEKKPKSEADKSKAEEEQEKFFYIDHESYEVKPIRITLLPKLVNFYST